MLAEGADGRGAAPRGIGGGGRGRHAGAAGAWNAVHGRHAGAAGPPPSARDGPRALALLSCGRAGWARRRRYWCGGGGGSGDWLATRLPLLSWRRARAGRAVPVPKVPSLTAFSRSWRRARAGRAVAAPRRDIAPLPRKPSGAVAPLRRAVRCALPRLDRVPCKDSDRAVDRVDPPVCGNTDRRAAGPRQRERSAPGATVRHFGACRGSALLFRPGLSPKSPAGPFRIRLGDREDARALDQPLR